MGHITRETCLLLAVRGPCGGAPQPHCTSPRRTFQDLCSPRRARRTRRGNSVHSSSSHGWDRGRPPPHARRNPVRQLILSILSILRSSAAAKDELSCRIRSSLFQWETPFIRLPVTDRTVGDHRPHAWRNPVRQLILSILLSCRIRSSLFQGETPFIRLPVTDWTVGGHRPHARRNPVRQRILSILLSCRIRSSLFQGENEHEDEDERHLAPGPDTRPAENDYTRCAPAGAKVQARGEEGEQRGGQEGQDAASWGHKGPTGTRNRPKTRPRCRPHAVEASGSRRVRVVLV